MLIQYLCIVIKNFKQVFLCLYIHARFLPGVFLFSYVIAFAYILAMKDYIVCTTEDRTEEQIRVAGCRGRHPLLL